MPKKRIIGVLLLFVFLVFGSSGCTVLKTSDYSRSSNQSSPNSPIQSVTTNSSNETFQDKLSDNQVRPLSIQETEKTLETQATSATQGIPILYYHSVKQENGNELRMPPEQFEAQMAYLQKEGYQSLSMAQLYKALYKGGTLPAKPFVITFDDGYIDNYTTAFPILTQHDFKATVFMVTSYINGDGFMSWPQLKVLVANGWEIEGHTANHPYLTKIDSATLFNEIGPPKMQLEKELGQPVDFFAYPFGDLNDNVVQALKSSGYLMAFTTERGWADFKTDAWHVHRVYCYASMGMNEFKRRVQDSNY